MSLSYFVYHRFLDVINGRNMQYIKIFRQVSSELRMDEIRKYTVLDGHGIGAHLLTRCRVNTNR
jgi:hypothetical protein